MINRVDVVCSYEISVPRRYTGMIYAGSSASSHELHAASTVLSSFRTYPAVALIDQGRARRSQL